MADVLRDRGLSRLLGPAPLERLADGFQFVEGPLWLPDGSVLFQDIKAEFTHRIGPDGGVTTLRTSTGAANGQTFDSLGRVVFCEQNGRRVSRMNADGTGVEVVAEADAEDRRLNSPNDVVAHASGNLYFTDPPYGVAPEARSIPYQGVYLLDSLGVPRLVADDFEKPNGLAVSPDQRTLYVCDTGRYHVRAFEIDPSGALSGGRVVATMDPDESGGPDGMKVDRDGRLYVAVAQGVWVYEPDGSLLGILSVPRRPSNLAWCGVDGSALFITAVDAVYRLETRVNGLMPPFTPGA